MTWQASLNRVIGDLRKEEQRLERELGALRTRIGSLSGATRSKGTTRKAPGARKMSAKGRAAISRAAKKRWAAWRKAKKAKSA
jgi:hypothetical protein